MEFHVPDDSQNIIKVIGVGGGGSNAVNYMYQQGIVGVDFAICNTDNQAMNQSPIPTKIQLGPSLTEGRGAGSKPEIGKEACEESLQDVLKFFDKNTKMLFVTAGMGGGTGTGAAPVVAKAARDMGILTVGIVTIPFTFEGRRRQKQAMEGLNEFQKNVDTLIVISNDKLRKIYGNLNLSEAFSKADDILTIAAKGIAEIITVPGYVNVDFEDVNTVMRNSGVAVMGTAIASGEGRALKAVESALQSPLLEDNNIEGAEHILINITSGESEVKMDEVFEITEYVQQEAGYGTDVIWGNCSDHNLGDGISVTVIATGFNKNNEKESGEMFQDESQVIKEPVVVNLDDSEPHSVTITESPTSPVDDITKVDLFSDADTTANTPTETPVSKPDNVVEFDHMETLDERRRRLEDLSVKLTNPKVLKEVEDEPAYLRKGVKLDDEDLSNAPHMSKWSVSNDDEPEINENNSYLHDNID